MEPKTELGNLNPIVRLSRDDRVEIAVAEFISKFSNTLSVFDIFCNPPFYQVSHNFSWRMLKSVQMIV